MRFPRTALLAALLRVLLLRALIRATPAAPPRAVPALAAFCDPKEEARFPPPSRTRHPKHTGSLPRRHV